MEFFKQNINKGYFTVVKYAPSELVLEYASSINNN